MTSPLLTLFKRELLLGWRGRGESAANLVFILLIITLFPFALGSDEGVLQNLSAGLLLIALMLGQMMGFERLFRDDYQNGTLDIISMSAIPLPFYALIKSFAQWLTLILPVLLICPILMLLLHVAPSDMAQLLASLALASLTIQLLGMLGAALSLGAKQAGLLLPLLLIPFYIPVMIFAVAFANPSLAAEARQAGYFLCALFVVYLTLLPYLSGLALRSAIESS